jgi:murein DD-endopeptidase MepM/ murein hydrolase activator NlpD
MSKIVLPISSSLKAKSGNGSADDIGLKPLKRSTDINSSISKSKTLKITLPIIDVERVTSPFRELIFSNQNQLVLASATGSLNAYNSFNAEAIEVSPISEASKIFTDIFPNVNIYRGPISGLWHDIEEFYEFLLENNFFFGFLIFLFNELLTNIAYQSHLLVMSVLDLASESSNIASNLVEKLNRLVNIFNSEQLRGIWWLNITTDSHLMLNNLLNLAKNIWNVLSKFYLVTILVLCVGFLQNATPKIANSANLAEPSTISRSSILEQAFSSNSLNLGDSKETSSGVSTAGYSFNITAPEEIDPNYQATKIIQYTVKENENLAQLSVLYNVSVESLTYSNGLTKDVEVGQKIVIPPVDAYIYKARKNDTLDKIAFWFKVDSLAVTSLNSSLYPEGKIKEGDDVMVPSPNYDEIDSIIAKIDEDAVQQNNQEKNNKNQKIATNNSGDPQYNNRISKTDQNTQKSLIESSRNAAAAISSVSTDSSSSCGMIWPTTVKTISQYFKGQTHTGIDIASRSLPNLFAVQDGVVVYSGWDSSGYGNMILIDHKNGFKTRYAHASANYAKVGQFVKQGEAIAKMGSTGRSTGPHLHFEVIKNGKIINPMSCY